MKYRQGFVSNSSSASFIVTIKENEDVVLDDFLSGYFESIFGPNVVLKKFVESYDFWSKHNKDIPMGPVKLQQSKKNLDEISSLIDKAIAKGFDYFSKEEKWEYVRLVLEESWIYLTRKNNCCVLKGEVTIFNDFQEVPKMLADIITASVLSGRHVLGKTINDPY